MKSKPECDQCFLRQATHAANLAHLAPSTTEELIIAVKEELTRTPGDVSPPVRASRVHAVVRQISANPDPYREAKQQATRQALNSTPN
ncbi:hypothetical protein BOW51_05725 [Solemya velesiana gill symbiont]|uniref:Damage-control phosphatase ARMT1-like metal-binding domain-containing protein n=1 Tax=Solemya velesiana gill symbiont TaxID=1918948 RepID=A0A1T2KV32_9GAMM|nr:ARMT1-like domain-containing protein [Solemya velesiana gill symbiont]OOZ36707.1 hypothetical protein BOW51_05725 [Solemya velesiana gill symbiont]